MSSTEEILKPALDAYGEELRAHGHDFAGWPERRCLCGWTPKRQSRDAGRAVGLHVAAAHKRASRAYDVESARLLAETPATTYSATHIAAGGYCTRCGAASTRDADGERCSLVSPF